MRYKAIAAHLRPYLIVRKRTTTINHAFAAAIAPCDSFDHALIREAMRMLDQDPDSDLTCVYCGVPAETWDHVFAIVQNNEFSGYGHRIGNLLPCCKPCNSKKGNKNWREFLMGAKLADSDRIHRIDLIEAYLQKYRSVDSIPKHLQEYQALQAIRRQVIELFSEADAIAATIRSKTVSGPPTNE